MSCGTPQPLAGLCDDLRATIAFEQVTTPKIEVLYFKEVRAYLSLSLR
jgi:hypothetical protein